MPALLAVWCTVTRPRPAMSPSSDPGDPEREGQESGDLGHRTRLAAQLGDGAVLDLQHAHLFPAPPARRDQGLDRQVEAGLRASTGPGVRPDGRRSRVLSACSGSDGGASIGPVGGGYAVGLAGTGRGRRGGGRGELLGLGLGVATTAPPAAPRGAARVEAEPVHDVGESRLRGQPRRQDPMTSEVSPAFCRRGARPGVGPNDQSPPNEPCSSARSSGVSSWPTRSTRSVIS